MLRLRFVLVAACVVLMAGGCLPTRSSGTGGSEASREATAAATPPAAPTRPAAEATPERETKAEAAPTAGEARAARPELGQRQAKEPQPAPAAAANAYHGIEDVVAKIRGLKPTRPVDLRFMSQQELREYFQDAFDRDYTAAERARDQKLLVTLGLIGPDQDLTAIMLSLLAEQVIGFYDDDTRRMYLIGEVAEPTPASKVTFAHEVVHALQDEYFNLKVLNPPDSDNDDRSGAIHALVEGDATLTMSLYARNELSERERREYAQSQSEGDSRALEEAPLVLRVELIFPYVEGLRFVQSLHRAGGFAAVDSAFREPPQSTEQILHPDKYVAREAPTVVDLPDLAAALGEGWRQTAINTLGELDLRILVEQNSDRQTAERAAAGWAGDRYALLEDAHERAAVVMKTTWDGPQDAWEFFRAYSEALQKRFGPQARTVARDPSRLALAGDGYAALVELRGQDVVVALAPDEAVMQVLGRALGGS
jgi:hypothetical protein